MTSRLVLSKKDPRRTDFYRFGPGDHGSTVTGSSENQPLYSSDTTYYARPRNSRRAVTTITRADPVGTGDRLQVGVIEWPESPQDPARVVVGTKEVQMVKTGIFTSSERFVASDDLLYEWQIQDARPQLVSLRDSTPVSTSYVATFVQSETGFFFRRKRTCSLFVPPEGSDILNDIVVTFIYFQTKWRDKESIRSRSSISGPIM